MTSSDGFYSSPLWKTPENSTLSSSGPLVSSGKEETSPSQTVPQQVEEGTSQSRAAEAFSDEHTFTNTQPVSPTHACLWLTEAVVSHAQASNTALHTRVPGSPFSFPENNKTEDLRSDNTFVKLQDGLASGRSTTAHADKMFSQDSVMAGGLSPQPYLESRVPTETSEAVNGHGTVLEHEESVLLSSEAGTEAVKAEYDEVTAVDSKSDCQEALCTSAGESLLEVSVQNMHPQLTPAVVCRTQDLNTTPAMPVSESLSSLPAYNCGAVSSDCMSLKLQDGLASGRSPPTHTADKMFSQDLVRAGGVSLQPFLGSRTCTETSETLAGYGAVLDYRESVLLQSEAGTEVVKTVSEEDFQEHLPTSAGKSTVEVSVSNGCLQLTPPVVCAQDLHTAPAVPVSESLSPSPEYNCGAVSSDNTSVKLQDGLASGRAPTSHTADKMFSQGPVMDGGLSPQPYLEPRVPTETSETLAGHDAKLEHEESVLLLTEAGTDGDIVKAECDAVTAVDSVKSDCQESLSTSTGESPLEVSVQNLCQNKTVDSLFPNALEEEHQRPLALSERANLNEACLFSKPLSKSVTHREIVLASETTDTRTKKKQMQTRCSGCSRGHHQREQARADPAESAGLPYSLRGRRRGAPSCCSADADSSSAPGSAKRSCPGPVQTPDPSTSPVEGSSQDASSPLAMPVKRKRGRPRKIQHPANVNEVLSTVLVPSGKVNSSSPVVCKSATAEDNLKETPDMSLASRGMGRRKGVAARKVEGQGNASALPGPTPAPNAEPLRSESQPPDLPAAPSSDPSQPNSDPYFEQMLQEESPLMPLTPLSLPEEEEEEDPDDDEELPSFLERKPLSITEGLCVWCKYRKHPFWPAVVKSVNHKNKKASIVFIDAFLFDEKRIRKGLTVSLKTLKPFDCEDVEELTEQAKQHYGDAIMWCLDLIYDYRIRIGCGSFSGSFIEYFANDVSSPLRFKYSQGTSDLTFPTHLIVDDLCDSSEEDTAGDQADEHQCKKLLPDRSKAARNRANKRLVDFIVRKRGAEKRLLAVVSGQETSKWLRAHQKASRVVVDPYLEDEEQVDQVYRYLDELLRTSPQTMPCLASLERIPFILDVLLPEALIYAIAGVDDLSLEEAEEKYRKGPCISNRERQEFNMKIEQLMKTVSHCKHVL